MEKVGYIYNSLNKAYVKEQNEAIRNFGVTQTIFDEKDILTLQPGDKLVIYELKSLGKTLKQIPPFLLALSKKNITLKIIRKEDSLKELTEEEYFTILIDLAEMDQLVAKERTNKGIQKAKLSGRIGGRPKISNDIVEEIKYLYLNQSYTLKEISVKCGVSLGTVYKYVQLEKKVKLSGNS